jgi:hypothetical protein
MKKSNVFIKLIIISLLGIILINCNKEEGKPPILPPQQSMVIDFSNFVNQNKSAEIVASPSVNNNWGFAALVAGYFNTVAFVTLAVPVYSFKLATDVNPVYLENKTWQWSYNSTVAGANYTCRLTGQIREKDVLWNMYISREGTGGHPEFIWYTGTSELDGSKGQWILNHSYQFQEPLLQIDWTKTGTGMGSVKYTYIRSLNDNRIADPFKNSYFEYGRITGSFDSYYNVHYFNGSTFSDVNVEWNSASHNGRVKCSVYFGDNNWHCWDASLANTTCP